MSIGKRTVLIVVMVAAVVAIAAAAAVLLRTSARLGPQPEVVVLDAPATAPAMGRADFTVIDPPRPAPQTAFVDGDGRQVTLADFRGRVVLLNLWATWCAPCVEEMPALDRLQASLGGEDFAVVAVSFDRAGLEAVKPFYAEHGLENLAVYADTANAMTGALDVRGLPTSFLINRDGAIVGSVMGAVEWDSPESLDRIRAAIAGAGT